MKKYYTYIVEGSNHWYYVGQTNNIFRRITEHKVGKGGRYTYFKFRGKLLLRYVEEFDTRQEAEDREKQLKGWSRKKKEALMKRNIDKLEKLAKKRFNKRKTKKKP